MILLRTKQFYALQLSNSTHCREQNRLNLSLILPLFLNFPTKIFHIFIICIVWFIQTKNGLNHLENDFQRVNLMPYEEKQNPMSKSKEFVPKVLLFLWSPYCVMITIANCSLMIKWACSFLFKWYQHRGSPEILNCDPFSRN